MFLSLPLYHCLAGLLRLQAGDQKVNEADSSSLPQPTMPGYGSERWSLSGNVPWLQTVPMAVE